MPVSLRNFAFGFLLCSLISLSLFQFGAVNESTFASANKKNNSTTGLAQYGIVGDGIADDTLAIQKAVDSSEGEIRFPRGIFRVTKTVLIDLDRVGPTSLISDGTARIVMDGEGPAFRFLGTHGGTAAPHTVKENVWKNQRTPMVDGLEIIGTNPKACGIEANGTMQITITRTVIRKTFHALHFVNRNRNVLISDCHIYENAGVGVFYDNVNIHQTNIIGSHISYNNEGGIVIRGGDVRNVHIGTCDIEGNMGDKNSKPTANVLMDSTGGSIGEVAIVGCTIQHTHNAPGSANIRFNGESTPRKFTKETRHGNLTIADNVLSDVQVNIELLNSRGVTITGNTIWKGYQHNLLMKNCQSVLISNNMFDRNPRYNYGDGKDSKGGILISDSDSCTISGNHTHGVNDDTPALRLIDCSRFNITSCTIIDCTVGIQLENLINSRITDCLIRDDREGNEKSRSIISSGGGGNEILDNMIKNDLR